MYFPSPFLFFFLKKYPHTHMRDRYVVSVSAGIQGEPAYDLNHIGISRQSLSNDPGLDETVLDNLYRYVIFKNND